MRLNFCVINMATDIPTCISIQETQEATQHDVYVQELKDYIIIGWKRQRWGKTRHETLLDFEIWAHDAWWDYWKGTWVISAQLQQQVINELKSNPHGNKNGF